MLEIHLDPVGGIAGDMFVAALLDYRPDLEAGLIETLSLCPLIDHVEVSSLHHNDGILTGRRFLVEREGKPAEDDAQISHYHSDDHGHDHAHDHHHHDRPHAHGHHDHVDWHVIRSALQASRLDADTIKHALGIFTLLAGAEAKVHGVDPDKVRFHEVGAWDSIADIVAAAWLIAQIGAQRWTISALPVGSGRIKTAHGLLPVPAPATALLLEGFLTIVDGIAGERITPTGAAIVRYLCDPTHDTGITPRKLIGSAHGFGTKRFAGISNCVRLLAFETPAVSMLQDRIAILECEIDDQTGEDIAHAIERLRGTQGVLDVIQMPVFGKKGRMMTHLRVLADVGRREEIIPVIFDETTTIGIRHSISERRLLARSLQTVTLDDQTLQLKLVTRPSGPSAKLEADDLRNIKGNTARNRLRSRVQAAIRKDQP